MALKIALVGPHGRMGLAVAAAAKETDSVIVAPVERGFDLREAARQTDVLIDFSSPASTRPLLEAALAEGRPVVIGTTGHSGAELAELKALAARIPCVWSGNFSVGVNLLFALTRKAAKTLGPEYDVELVEMHHRLKKDSPSGTAVRLIEILLEERRLGGAGVLHGRVGAGPGRTPGEIGVHSIRGGDVVGEHTVVFAGPGERIELAHKASERAIFARGALKAAAWVRSKPAGLYDMQDVLGLA